LYLEGLYNEIGAFRQLFDGKGNAKLDIVPQEYEDLRSPITIEHPLRLSRRFYEAMVEKFGAADLLVSKVWGEPPTELLTGATRRDWYELSSDDSADGRPSSRRQLTKFKPRRNVAKQGEVSDLDSEFDGQFESDDDIVSDVTNTPPRKTLTKRMSKSNQVGSQVRNRRARQSESVRKS
jgi:hypothetical protein